MSKIRLIVVCSTCLGLFAYGVAHAQTISMTSPFLPRNGNAIGQTSENSPVELRGILKDDGTSVFGLYDPVKKQGGWVKLNETGKDFPATVRSYDAAGEAITVEYQGRVLNLALKTAKIESLPITAQNLSPRPLPAQPGTTLAATPSVDNARQMEAVAAEVQRRRLQRQAALQRQGAGQPGALPPNAPGQLQTVSQPPVDNQSQAPRGNGIGRGQQ